MPLIMLCRVLTDLGAKYDIAVEAPQHTSKGPAEPGNASRGRGASSMNNGGRLVYTLTVMSPEEAQCFGIPESERTGFIRMDSAKVNITKRLTAARWFHLIGVRLGNATDMYPNGDDVQTVEPWRPPNAWEHLSAPILNRILDHRGWPSWRDSLHRRRKCQGRRGMEGRYQARAEQDRNAGPRGHPHLGENRATRGL